MKLEEIKKYIKDKGLNSKSRVRGRVYKRAYICAYLRRHTDLSLEEIGRLIGKDHSTVLHYIRNIHTPYTEMKDKLYNESTRELQRLAPIEQTEAVHKTSSVELKEVIIKLRKDEIKNLKMYMIDNDLRNYDQAIKQLVTDLNYQNV